MWEVESSNPNTDEERKASVTVRTYGDIPLATVR